MKISALAQKKICLLFPGEHERQEWQFLHNFLLPGNPPITWELGLKRIEIPIFAKRCHAFDVQILGFEVHTDSPYPLQETCFEDFSKVYNPDWYLNAMSVYNKMGITDMIIPVINIEKETLEKYLY